MNAQKDRIVSPFERCIQELQWNCGFSSGSSIRVRGGQETWNLCDRLWWPSFLWPIFTGPGGAMAPSAPPWIRYWASRRDKLANQTCWHLPFVALMSKFNVTKALIGWKMEHLVLKRIEQNNSRFGYFDQIENWNWGSLCLNLMQISKPRRISWMLTAKISWWSYGKLAVWCRLYLRSFWFSCESYCS